MPEVTRELGEPPGADFRERSGWNYALTLLLAAYLKWDFGATAFIGFGLSLL